MKIVQCPRCGHTWESATLRSKRKCKICGRSAGRRAEIAEV